MPLVGRALHQLENLIILENIIGLSRAEPRKPMAHLHEREGFSVDQTVRNSKCGLNGVYDRESSDCRFVSNLRKKVSSCMLITFFFFFFFHFKKRVGQSPIRTYNITIGSYNGQ